MLKQVISAMTEALSSRVQKFGLLHHTEQGLEIPYVVLGAAKTITIV